MVAVKTRKLARAAEARARKEGDLSPALRMGFARAAKELLDLPLAVIGIDRDAPAPVDAAMLCADGALCFVLGAPDEPPAAAFLGAGMVAALIRQQTIGRIEAGSTTQEPRALTTTDAALCAPFIEAAFRQLCRLAPQDTGRLGLDAGLTCTWLPTSHDAKMALGTRPYAKVALELDLGGGAVQGNVTLLIAKEQPPEPTCAEQTIQRRTGPAAVMLEVPAELDAVLCRMSLSLTALGKLSQGDVLPLWGATVERTALVDLAGHEVARVVLGQLNGARAVRISGRDTDMARVSERGAAPARFKPADPPALEPPPTAEEATIETPGGAATVDVPVGATLETDVGSFSVEDAAAEITSLAGLTEEDLADISAAATADVTGQPV